MTQLGYACPSCGGHGLETGSTTCGPCKACGGLGVVLRQKAEAWLDDHPRATGKYADLLRAELRPTPPPPGSMRGQRPALVAYDEVAEVPDAAWDAFDEREADLRKEEELAGERDQFGWRD